MVDSPSEEEASDEEDSRRSEQHEEVRGGVLGIEGARELRVRETFREEVVKKSRWGGGRMEETEKKILRATKMKALEVVKIESCPSVSHGRRCPTRGRTKLEMAQKHGHS